MTKTPPHNPREAHYDIPQDAAASTTGVAHTTPLTVLSQSTARPASPANTPHFLASANADTIPNKTATSLYIHIPFCFHKCHYCDFYSIVDSRDRQGVFTDRLCRELEALAPHAGPLDTIFVGGGTPTLLRTDLWQQLLATLTSRFHLTPATEFTVECNPETAREDLFSTLVAGGVNRLSMGAQSFNPQHLKTLERWHDPDSVARAVDLARAAGIGRISIDLIYAIPGQTLEDWHADLDTALSLGLSHLSAYNLTYEPNTAMTKRLERGEFDPMDEDTEIAMFEHTTRRAAKAGFERYEVSNYARPGEACRHNLAYWRQRDWLAAGPSASGHLAGHRWKNAPRLDTYLNAPSPAGHAPIVDHEPPDAERALAERIMTGLRLAEGLDAPPILAAAPDPARLERVIANHTDLGHLHWSADRWVLTESGMLLADGIAAELMAAVHTAP